MKKLKLYFGLAGCCLCSKPASTVLVVDGIARNTYCGAHGMAS